MLFFQDFIYYNGIDENIIHMIVTMAINNIDSYSDLSLLNRRKIVKESRFLIIIIIICLYIYLCVIIIFQKKLD